MLSDFQHGLGAAGQGHVARDVPHGEAEADGNIVGLQHVGQGLVERFAQRAVLLVLGELADEESAQFLQYAAQLQVVQHPLHGVRAFAHVLQEKNRPFRRDVPRRAAQAVGHGKIASTEDAARSALVIEPMCLANDVKVLLFLGVLPEEDVVQRLHRRIVVRFHGEVAGHRGVQRDEALVLEDVVQGGDVAEADEPLGLLAEAGEVQLVHQMHGPVAPAATEDGACLRVVHGLLQVLQPLGDRTRIRAVRAACVGSQHRLQSPRLEPPGSSPQEGFVYLAGRGEDDDAVALTEAGRADISGFPCSVLLRANVRISVENTIKEQGILYGKLRSSF